MMTNTVSQSTASYSVTQLAEALREARISLGMTQRELAERAGIAQSRLALIEAGDVDLRASTLVQLARALDLELTLTPRRVLSAVQSLIGSRPQRSQQSGRYSVRGTPVRVLRHIEQQIAALERTQPSNEQLAKAKRAVAALNAVGPNLGISSLQPLRRSVHWLGLARANKAQAKQPLAKAAEQLQELYQTLPAMTHLEQAPHAQRAAYSLEDEIS